MAWPEDFPDPKEDSLFAALRTGLWQVDWWDGDPRGKPPKRLRVDRAYFLRPAVDYKFLAEELKGKAPFLAASYLEKSHKIFDGTYGGRCILLKDTGCSLPFDRRPTQCRLLKPSLPLGESGDPKAPDKRQAAIAWLPYRAVIEKAAERAFEDRVERREQEAKTRADRMFKGI